MSYVEIGAKGLERSSSAMDETAMIGNSRSAPFRAVTLGKKVVHV